MHEGTNAVYDFVYIGALPFHYRHENRYSVCGIAVAPNVATWQGLSRTFYPEHFKSATLD